MVRHFALDFSNIMAKQKPAVPAVQLHLLDSALGHPVQTWRFADRTSILIGRAERCDITTTDSRVSRQHAEIKFAGGSWLITSLGRNGVLVDSRLVAEAPLGNNTIFQLGPGGPSFQFCENVRTPRENCETIDNVDPSILSFLDLDEGKKEEEIKKIVEGASFQELQERSRKLKQMLSEEETESS
jgi:pSer/pThr/pTyr-binding forkhead associated (FHA) protein